MAISGLAVIAGSLLPWFSVRAGEGNVVRTGLEERLGWWTLVSGGLVALTAILANLVRRRTGWALFMGLAFSLFSGCLAVYALVVTRGRTQVIAATTDGLSTSTGLGIWLIAIGAALGLIVTIASLQGGTGKDAQPSA